MKSNYLSLLLILCAWFVLSANSCSPKQKPDTSKQTQVVKETVFKDLDTETFKTQYARANNALLLDVRTPEEVSEGYIKGAKNIDFYNESFKTKLDELDKNQAIYVYCRSGGRSGNAMEMMKEMGFKEVYNLLGGFKGWKAANNDVLIPPE